MNRKQRHREAMRLFQGSRELLRVLRRQWRQSKRRQKAVADSWWDKPVEMIQGPEIRITLWCEMTFPALVLNNGVSQIGNREADFHMGLAEIPMSNR